MMTKELVGTQMSRVTYRKTGAENYDVFTVCGKNCRCQCALSKAEEQPSLEDAMFNVLCFDDITSEGVSAIKDSGRIVVHSEQILVFEFLSKIERYEEKKC